MVFVIYYLWFYSIRMEKRTLTPEQAEECERLKNIYRATSRSRRVTQSAVADALNITQAAVSHYLNGKNPLNTRVAAVFSQMLEIPVRSFSHRLADQIEQTTKAAQIGAMGSAENSNVRVTAQPAMSYKYPVISWVAAGNWAEAIEPFPPGFGDRYELTDYRAHGPAFWLEVKGDSMTAPAGLSIPEGMLILVDTEADARSGKLVVAKLTESNEATFKKLVEDSGQRFLKPLNPFYPMMQINGNCKIVGVVVRAMVRL